MLVATTSLAQAVGTQLPIPSPDPLGFPLPAWILQTLAYLTLTLHFSAIHFTIGATLLLLWFRVRRAAGQEDLGRFLGSGLPLGVSYIITMGIPPLLFVQVLYGQLFYSSSVLIGAFWIQVIPAVMLAYAGFYYHKLRRDTRPRLQGLVLAVSVMLLLYVGYIYVNNLTLVMSPEKWMGLYAQAPGGSNLHHGEPTIHSRFLLFLSSSFAVAGLVLIWRGVFLARWGFAEVGRRSRSVGFRAFLVSPLLWIIALIGVYATRPEDMSAMLSSGLAPKILVVIGVIGGVVALICAYLAVNRVEICYALTSSLAMIALTGSMVVFRDLVRLRELSSHWSLSSVAVNAQWSVFLLFLAALAGGIVLLVALSIKIFPALAQDARERLAAPNDGP
jgi:hypothetical protein